MSVRDDERAEKAAWRARFRALRAGQDPDARAQASARIVDGLKPLLASARTVSLFWPLVERGEVDLRPLVAWLVDRGIVVALPVVASQQPPRLAHRAVAWDADLVAGPLGLAQPAPGCPPVAPGAVDVAVVPALGLGRDGSRLGYGGGYYDRFLSQALQAQRVGVVWAAALVDALPAEPHDVRMDIVVTDAEVWPTHVQREDAP